VDYFSTMVSKRIFSNYRYRVITGLFGSNPPVVSKESTDSINYSPFTIERSSMGNLLSAKTWYLS